MQLLDDVNLYLLRKHLYPLPRTTLSIQSLKHSHPFPLTFTPIALQVALLLLATRTGT
jgi:hypothetical protein